MLAPRVYGMNGKVSALQLLVQRYVAARPPYLVLDDAGTVTERT
jgi:hypothetical protein